MFGFFREKYNLGDVLYCRKSMCTHYGIYVGKGQVVHFASDGKGEILNPEAAVVKKTSLKVFSYGEDIYVNNSPTRLSPEQIVSNATSQIGSNEGGYDSITNNSEHFARWCETGVKQTSAKNTILNGTATAIKGILDLFS